MSNSTLRLLASSQIASVLTDGGGGLVPVVSSSFSSLLMANIALAKAHTGAGSQ